MKFKILTGILLCLNIAAYAQTIKGKIYDTQTKEPVVAALVKEKNSVNATKTNNEGYFELTCSQLSPDILISCISYKNVEIKAYNNQNIELTPDSRSLQSVMVTANREASLRSETPIAITKLSAKLIDETKATTLFEVVNKTPGVLMVDLGNEQHMMSIRQPITTNPYYLYMEDGVPIRPMGVFNHNALLQVNQYTVSSIEVVKGPVSSIYGPEAIGGAVNFIMQRPTIVPTAKAGFQFDNWGYKRFQFGTGATIGKFGFYVGGLTSKQTNSWMTASDYNKQTVNARLEYNFTPKTRLIGNFIYGKYNSQMSGSVDSIAFYSRNYLSTSDFAYRKSDANRTRLTLEHEWNENAKSFVTIFNRNDELGQNPSYGIRWKTGQTTATGQINANNFNSYGVIAQHSQHFNFLNSKLIAGAMFDYSPNDYWAYQTDLNAQVRPDGKSVEKYSLKEERPDIQLANYNAKIRNAASYLQYDFEPVKKIRFSTGLRYDRMSFTYINNLDNSAGEKAHSKLTPKIGVTYQIDQEKGLYANYAQGFSPTALTAIFRAKPNTSPAQFYYNLEPATFQNYELGGWATFFNHKVYADIAIYQMDGKNELLSIRQPDNSTDYQSAGKTLHRGIEFGITANPNPQFSFRFGGTVAIHKFINFQVSDNPKDALQNLNNYEMPSAPRWVYNTELNYYPKQLPNLRMSVELQYLSSYYQNQINTVKYDGYTLLNYRIGYKIKGVEVYSNVMNLGNTLYATNVTRGNNATDTSTFTPAAPRTFVFGIQYNFAGKK